MSTRADQAASVAPDEVTLANWMRPPYNRVSFQRVGDLVPSVRVSGARSVRCPWPADASGPRTLDGRLGAQVAEVLDTTYTDAFVVLVDGEVRHEEYRSGMTPTTRHLCMSVSKSITGTVAGMLVGSEVLDPATQVTDLVPEFIGTGLEGATVRQVLDMRTGTREDITTLELQRAYYATALWAPPPEPDDPGRDTDTRQHFWRLLRERDHGTDFQYRSTLTCVLALLLERASGKQFPELLTELWQALGAETHAEITVDGAGFALADIGLSCTARDLARLGEVLRRGGLDPAGQRVLSAAWVADTLTPDRDSQQAFAMHGRPYLPTEDAYYRNQWWVAKPRRNGRDGEYFALGIHGQLLYIDEAAELVVVKFSTWPEPWDDQFVQETYDLCHRLRDSLV